TQVLVAIEVRSTPPGATVAIGGAVRGRTPLELEVPPATAITVKRAGHRSARVTADRAGTIDVVLAPLPRAPSRTRKPRGETLD
nr:PEGA domain-containing protein [Deltaproteobacteria bacterium]